MYVESEQEQERMRQLDKLRKLVRTLLGHHIPLLVFSFFLILGGTLFSVGFAVTTSSQRYVARVTLCFQPKQKGKVGQYDDRYVLQILNRRASKLKFAKAGERDGSDPRKKVVSENISVTYDRKQPHNFNIVLYAYSEKEAVASINDFAKVCIAEYVRERTTDLEKWKNVLAEERREVVKRIEEFSARISELTIPLNVVSPERDYERLRGRLNELQTSRTRLRFVVENLARRKAELEKKLSAMSPAMLSCQAEIKKFFTELERLDKEIVNAEEVFTDENPKVIALQNHYAGVQKRLERFLKARGIGAVTPQILGEAEKLTTELKGLQMELDGKQGELAVLDGEIAETSKKFQKLTDYQPKLRQLTQQRRGQQESLERLNESIAEINYTLLMVEKDIFVNEQARNAVGNAPFSKKNLFICLFAAIVLTGFLAASVALLDFFFGKVVDSKELELYEEFHYLGMLPTSEKMFNSEDMERMVMFKLFHKFQSLDTHVIFSGALSGAKILPQLFDFLDWNLSMAGRRMLTVDIVPAEEFDAVPDENSDTMLLTFSQGKCHLPLTSRKFLVSSELELLKNDFNVLRDRYDYIFIRHSGTLRRSELFLEQIAALCDCALIGVGAGRTPRKSLRRLLTLQLKINIPVMTVLTESSERKLKKNLKKESEA